MQKIILHLGLAKTGTSWLQQKVFPEFPLNFFLCSHYEVLNKYKGDMLLSFEGFSGTIRDNDRYVNAYRLHKLFPNAKIIVVFREKNSYLHSLYSQFIRGGGIWSFEEFKQWAVNHPYFMDWELYKKYLCRLFDDVLFLDFNDMKNNHQVFIKKICDFIDIPTPVFIDYKSVNTSLSDRQLKIWGEWNKLFKSKWNSGAFFPRFFNPCFIYNKLRLGVLF